ncbi:DUF3333 domain-containing protein, partial [Acinetobacter baumannii]
MMNTTANTSPATGAPADAAKRQRLATIQASLKARHRSENRFRWFGIASIAFALAFVVILFGSIMSRGLPAFWQSAITLDVHFDPAIID